MNGDTRIATTKATIRGLFTAARLLNQDTKFTVRSFSGPQWENVPTQIDMDSVLNAMVFNTGESLPGPLNARVTTPVLAAASTRVLKPTIVVMITDGDVSSHVHIRARKILYPYWDVHVLIKSPDRISR